MSTRPLLALSAVLTAACLLAACDDDGSSNPDDTTMVDTSVGDTDPGDTSPDMTPGSNEGLVINEVAAGETPDWIELYNGTDHAIDLTGFSVSDVLDDRNRRAELQNPTTIESGAYLVVELSSDTWPGWALGSAEAVGLFEPGLADTPLDSTAWEDGQSPTGGSWGRIPDGTGAFKSLDTQTRGAANVDNMGGATCGNGTVEAGEACDDGNVTDNDGCDGACEVEDGYTCTGDAPSSCETVCGDQILAGDEACDPATAVAWCDAQCQLVITPGAVVINEVQWDPIDPQTDWIELYNPGATDVAVGGWKVTDDQPVDHFVLLHQDTVVPAGGYLVLERDLATDPLRSFTFGLGNGDAVLLFDDAGTLIDAADWARDVAADGASFGRSPDGTGAFGPIDTPSRGAANP